MACPFNDPVEYRRDSLEEFPISRWSRLSQLRLSVASELEAAAILVVAELTFGVVKAEECRRPTASVDPVEMTASEARWGTA